VTAVPDLDELSSTDPNDWISEEPQRGAPDFILFAVGASLLLAFSFLNLYSLPLGTTSVASVLDNASSIYGSDVEVYGVMSHVNDMEFTLADANSTARIDAVWLGSANLPLNGSHVVATGQIVEGTAGPAMMCHSFTVRTDAVTSYESPFALPSIRIVSTIMVWFVATMFFTGLAALVSTRRPAESLKHYVRALIDICTVASGILTATMLALITAEPVLGNSSDAFAYCAAAAFLMLLLSSMTQNTRHADLKELSGALPVIAAIVTLFGLMVSLLSVPAALGATLFSEAAAHFIDSAPVVVVGISGLIWLGAYIARRKTELCAAEDSIAKISEAR